MVATALAIVIGTAFVAASLVIGSTLAASVRSGFAAEVAGFDVVVQPNTGSLTERDLRAVRVLSGVRTVDAQLSGGVELSAAAGGTQFAQLQSTPPPARRITMSAGRLPRSDGEIALGSTLAQATRVRVGQAVRVGTPSGGTAPARVVGLVDTRGDASLGANPVAFAMSPDIRRWSDVDTYDQFGVVVTPGVTASTAMVKIRAAVGPGSRTMTREQAVDSAADQATGNVNVLTNVLLGFAAIALFVAAIVIANTFAILMAQRSRETALLRCVGATRAQLVRAMLAESMALGLLAAAVGTAVGVGLAAVATALGGPALGLGAATFSITPIALVLPVLAGVLVTVIAAVIPIRRGTRILPVAALSAQPLSEATTSGATLRGILALVVCGTGTAALLLGASQGRILIAMGGGAVSFLGVVIGARILVPATARLFGLAARAGGVPGQLAAENAVRNPARASATSAALLVGVTLITLMSVGTATTQAAVSADINSHYALDASVSVPDGTLPAGTASGLAGIEGVRHATPVRSTIVHLGADQVPAIGISTSAAAASLRSPTQAAAIAPGVVLVGKDLARTDNLSAGQQARLRTASGSLSLRVVIIPADLGGVVLDPTDLARLAPHARVTDVWLRLSDDADLTRTLASIRSLAGQISNAQVGGAAPQRDQIDTILHTMFLVVTALLAVAVLIALVGIANTLALSVLERTRESAVLRALGLTRGQLRAMLSAEAVLLAGVGLVLGVLLGTLYGWAGARALLYGAAPVSGVVVPSAQIATIAVVAIVAALLASVLPGRRATRIAPAAAMAVE